MFQGIICIVSVIIVLSIFIINYLSHLTTNAKQIKRFVR